MNGESVSGEGVSGEGVSGEGTRMGPEAPLILHP